MKRKNIRNIQIVFDIEIDFENPNFMIFEATLTEYCVVSPHEIHLYQIDNMQRLIFW